MPCSYGCLVRRFSIVALVLLSLTYDSAVRAEQWTVAVAGNAYLQNPSGNRGAISRTGNIELRGANDDYCIYFHVDRPCELSLALNAEVNQGSATIEAQVAADRFAVTCDSKPFTTCPIGKIKIEAPGYVKLGLRGAQDAAATVAIRELLIQSETKGLVVDYVRNNEGNMFYWGRRGPSVHLRYGVPRDVELQYAYSEITIPEGQDVIGSYFMANGFGEGYFGMQVNGPNERRVLFSVWSPFQTDNPRDIPDDQRIVGLAKGPEVRLGEFGNEGSGGQSFLVYPWKAGITYRFLTEVRPTGKGSTRYTSWFGPKDGDFRLIASFERPQTNTTLKGFHSFLENFVPETGNQARRGMYGNVWVRDTRGNWHECTQATFSVDPTGRGRHRLDYTGGAEGNQFYMQNCGFFNETGQSGDSFTRTANGTPPQIDLAALATLAESP